VSKTEPVCTAYWTYTDLGVFSEQVESLLKTADPITASAEPPKATPAPNPPTFENRAQQAAATTAATAATASFNVTTPSITIANDRDMDRWPFNGESPQAGNIDEFNFAGNMPGSMPVVMDNMSALPNNFTWEMIGLGLEEPLPPQETIDEL
jgi:hypothetical protein